jgi:hypothetical protein
VPALTTKRLFGVEARGECENKTKTCKKESLQIKRAVHARLANEEMKSRRD